jgi:hypothetical protein
MFLEGDFFKQSCANEFAFNMGIMMAAVWHLTGMVLVGGTKSSGYFAFCVGGQVSGQAGRLPDVVV